MELEIRKLTPDLAQDYARFFDTTPHNDEGKGIKCYCVTWRNDDTEMRQHSGLSRLSRP